MLRHMTGACTPRCSGLCREDTNNDIQQDKHGRNDTNAAMKRPLGMWDARSHDLFGSEHVAAASQHHQPRAGGKAGPQRQQMSLVNRSQS